MKEVNCVSVVGFSFVCFRRKRLFYISILREKSKKECSRRLRGKFRNWSWAGWRKTDQKLMHLQQRLYGRVLGVITEGKGKLVRGSPSQALPNFFLRDCHSLVQWKGKWRKAKKIFELRSLEIAVQQLICAGRGVLLGRDQKREEQVSGGESHSGHRLLPETFLSTRAGVEEADV